jgi:hypothetical protein
MWIRPCLPNGSELLPERVPTPAEVQEGLDEHYDTVSLDPPFSDSEDLPDDPTPDDDGDD